MFPQITRTNLAKYIFRGQLGVVIFFLLISLLPFYRVFYGQVPMPGDLLGGAYLPWLDYKYGYSVRVPIQNTSLTDVVSAQYPWRELAIDTIKQGNWPLWNPYSFSGTPLMANLQSAPLYIFNIWMLIFSKLTGWTLLLFTQIFLSMIFMYLYLKETGLGKAESIVGSISFAFSGFMVTYLQYATIGQSFMWLPLLLLVTDKYFKENKLFWLTLVPLISFFIITAGSFQSAFYAFFIWFCYAFLKTYLYSKKSNDKTFFLKKVSAVFICLIFIFLVSAVQILPSVELFNLSIRNIDHNIQQYNFGLLPMANLATLFSPDFFGNPVTGNFWGKIGYQESTGYFGIIVMVFFIFGAYQAIKNKAFEQIFFLVFFLVSLLFIIDSPISRLVYVLKIPILSTSYATRIFLITDFSGAILAAYGFHKARQNQGLILKICLYTLAILIGIQVGLFISIKMADSTNFQNLNNFEIKNYSVALKNNIIPMGMIIILFMILKLFFRKKQLLAGLVIILVTIDLLRFDIKFNTFADKKFVYPITPVMQYLKNNLGYYRFDREHAEIIPPNTWIPYKIMSPSGYDPLHSLEYSHFYNVYNQQSPDSGSSRYSELYAYNSPILDLAGVKYITAVRRDSKGELSSKEYSYPQTLKDPKFKRAFEDKSVIILENSSVMPRVNLFENYDVEINQLDASNKLYRGYDFRKRIIIDDNLISSRTLKTLPTDQAEIIDYSSNKVNIISKTNYDSILMLTDAYYPGWEATIDGNKTKLFKADGVYRAILLPGGSHKITFSYNPFSFKISLILSISSIVTLLIIFFQSRRKNYLF